MSPPSRRRRRARSRAECPRRARRGAALVEAVVAALVLVVGVLATAGSVAGSARDAARGRAVALAGDEVAARVARWRAAPCAAGGGTRVLAGGAGREWWSVRVAGGVGELADTVRVGEGALAVRVGVVAVAGCAR